jgi:chemotaxis protein methyltransferase CheR
MPGVTAPATAGIVADPFYARVKALVIDRTGMAFYHERDDDFSRVLAERLATLGVSNCASYLERLQSGKELEELIADLTIGETYFFRYREQFEALRDIILPQAIERNQERKRLRIWSAGCSTGPEPYTVAIILKQRFGHRIEGWDVSIIGTDINQRFLARAREGLFEDWAFRSTPETVRNACFVREGKRWRIAPEYRQLVRFQYHNLVDDPIPSPRHDLVDLDVILCRNVVIYFTTETFRHIIGHFHAALNDDGWLVVGHSELNTELFRSFHTIDAPGAVLYRKGAAASPANSFDFTSYAAEIAAAPLPVRIPDPPPPLTSLPPLRTDTETLPRVVEPPANDAGPAEPEAAAELAEPTEPPLAELRRLADQGAWVEALRLCRRLLDADPLDAVVHLHHGLILEHTRQTEQAAEAVRRALYLDRTLALGHFHLGRLAANQGDHPAAARAFRNAQRLLDDKADAELVAGGDDMSVAELTGLLAVHMRKVGA